MMAQSPALPEAPAGGSTDFTGPCPAAEVEEILRRVEAEHDLLRYTVDGWCAWPLLRFGVAMELQRLPLSGGGLRRRGTLARVAEAVRGAGPFLTVRRTPYLAKTYTSGLGERTGGKYKDVWFDDLLLAVGEHVKLEAVNNADFLPRRAAALLPATLTNTPLEVLAGVLARGLPSAEIRRVAHALADVLAAELGTQKYDAPTVDRHLQHFAWSRSVYHRLLGRVRPTHVLTADPGEYALVAAAKELGITSVELQHGLLDRVSHPSYAWTAYAAPFKHRMPVPDVLFLYGDHWRDELQANGFWGDSARAVGSLRMEQYRRQRAQRRPGDAFTIVFSTQGLDVAGSIGFLRQFLTLGQQDRDLRLILKLHPVYDRDPGAYRAALASDSRACVLGAAEGETVFELIARADLHLSISSTCHYEALGLGVPTVVLPFTTSEVMAPLCRVGHARLASTPSELWEVVGRTRAGEAPSAPSEYYFKSGALGNMLRELRAGRAAAAPAAPSTRHENRRRIRA
jgi:hypothetical protein